MWLWTRCWVGRVVWRRWQITGMLASTWEPTSSPMNTGKSLTPVKNSTDWKLLCGEFTGHADQEYWFISVCRTSCFHFHGCFLHKAWKIYGLALVIFLCFKWIIEFDACPSGMWLPSWRRLSCSVSLLNNLRWSLPNRRRWTSGWSCFCRLISPQFPPPAAQ